MLFNMFLYEIYYCRNKKEIKISLKLKIQILEIFMGKQHLKIH